MLELNKADKFKATHVGNAFVALVAMATSILTYVHDALTLSHQCRTN